jgi:hypothetical protein
MTTQVELIMHGIAREIVSDSISELMQQNHYEWDLYVTHDVLLADIRNCDLLWVVKHYGAIRAFIAAQVVLYSNDVRALKVLCSAGFEIAVYLPVLLKELRLAAKLANCTRIEITGRKAWERMLCDVGVRTVSQNYILEV